jgi:FAD/FMN-containing dehydrogenase
VLRSKLKHIVGDEHVLTGESNAGYVVDWTGRFRGWTPAVIRPQNNVQVAAVLAACHEAEIPVVPQGGNTGLVGGGVPLHGELVLSLARLNKLGAVDFVGLQVSAQAGVTLERLANAHPDLDFPVHIASRQSATVGGAIATNAGGLRVLRYGPMRAQIRGVEAVLADGRVLSHMSGLTKDNTGYDYASMLAGSEGTLAVITEARLRLVPRTTYSVVVLIGAASLGELHDLAMRAVRETPGLVSAEFFDDFGLEVLRKHASVRMPFREMPEAYLLLEADDPAALGALTDLTADRPSAVAEDSPAKASLWRYRERQPEAAGFLGVPLKLDVSVPSAHWVNFTSTVTDVVRSVDPGAHVILFGHIADGNVHVNVVPTVQADGRHQDAVFKHVAALGGSISAEHGIGALKSRWLSLSRTETEQSIFRGIRAAFDPVGILNPNILPR